MGTFYSVNLAGAILGSTVTGFVLLPVFGSRGSLLLVAFLLFSAGLALLAVSAPLTTRRATAMLAAAGIFTLAGSRIGDPFDAFLAARYPEDRVAWRQESVQGTVSVHQQPGREWGLFVEGNHQASDGEAMVAAHRRIGHLGMLLHPDPVRALVIGLGGGATAGAVSLHAGVQVEIVELSAAVVRGAEFFSHVNHGVLRRPNAVVRVDDGRNFLLTTRTTYDVITADIILPIHAGANNLYSADYFRLVRDALSPNGLFVQWVAGTDAEYRTIARTFLAVFPDATAWMDGTMLVGSRAPIVLRETDFVQKRDGRGRQAAFADAGVRSFEEVVGLFRAGPEALRTFVGDGPILTDTRPLVEYFLSLPRDRPVSLRGLRSDVGPYLGR